MHPHTGTAEHSLELEGDILGGGSLRECLNPTENYKIETFENAISILKGKNASKLQDLYKYFRVLNKGNSFSQPKSYSRL